VLKHIDINVCKEECTKKEMTAVEPKSPKPLPYTRTLEGERSLMFPFFLFETMRLESVPLQVIAGDVGIGNGYTKRPLSELAAENALCG